MKNKKGKGYRLVNVSKLVLGIVSLNILLLITNLISIRISTEFKQKFLRKTFRFSG